MWSNTLLKRKIQKNFEIKRNSVNEATEKVMKVTPKKVET